MTPTTQTAHSTPSDSATITLAELGELFEAPTPDPLAGRFSTRSGIDLLIDTVESKSSAQLHVTIELDDDAELSEAPDRVSRALGGYCTERISIIDIQRAQVRRLGLKELRFGLIFLALCLLIGSTIAALDFGPEWLRHFFSEGLVIVGWIALWHPVDMLFFDRLPLVREQRILRRIQGARISVVGISR